MIFIRTENHIKFVNFILAEKPINFLFFALHYKGFFCTVSILTPRYPVVFFSNEKTFYDSFFLFLVVKTIFFQISKILSGII